MNIEIRKRLSEWVQLHPQVPWGKVVGIEIGGSKLQAICLSGSGELCDHRRAVADANGGAKSIRASLIELINEIKRNVGPVSVIGVGFGGIVNWATGTTKGSFQVRGWENFPLGEWIREKSGAEIVIVENDTNSATFAESAIGSGADSSHVLYSNSGSGVGAGYVVHKELFRGSSFFELELGHMRVGESLDSLQSLCSGWSIDERIRLHLRDHPKSDFSLRLHRLNCIGGFWGKAFDIAVSEQNPDAIRILNEVARVYALGLSHASYLLNPSVIVLGGGVALMGKIWSDTVGQYLDGFMNTPLATMPVVKLSALEEFVVPIGAALLALKRSSIQYT